MDATSGDTGTSEGLSIGTGDKPVYVTVGFVDPNYMSASATDVFGNLLRPYWLNDTSFGIKIEKQVNGVWSYVNEYWSNFRDSAYNPMDYISFDCSNANLNAKYKFSVSQEMWNPDKNMSVKFTGSAIITIGEQNYAYIGLKEETVVVFDPSITDNVEIILQLPDTDTTYTKGALTGKFAYVELMDQNFVSKYIMKLKIEDTTYSYDGTNSYPIFGAKGTFTSVPKYNYYFRAFIDWNGNVTTAMDVGITYQRSPKPNVFPDPEDIHPNLSNWTPVVSMDYEKYTDPNTNFTYPYSLWFSDWIEVTWGGTAVGTITLDCQSIGLNMETVYIRITDDTGAAIEPATGYAQFMLNAGMGYYDMIGAYTDATTYKIDIFVDNDGSGALSSGDLYNNTYSFSYISTGFALTVDGAALTIY